MSACACVGCPHPANCRCLCHICQAGLKKEQAEQEQAFDENLRRHEQARGRRKGAKPLTPAERALMDCHMLARRTIHRPSKAVEYAAHIVRICEAAGVPVATVFRVDPAEPQGLPAIGSDLLCAHCAKQFCPHEERMHFDKDGCPACEFEVLS